MLIDSSNPEKPTSKRIPYAPNSWKNDKSLYEIPNCSKTDGLKIEINMSNGTKYVDNIISYQPNKENIIGCHNFYPKRFTGLSRQHFLQTSQHFKAHNVRTAAMI